MIVGIIGGGASGMAAALAASQNPGVQVLLFERQARVGRKLQATGNGRCNLTNLYAEQTHYHGEDPAFTQYAMKMFSPKETLDWFENMGLYTVAEPSGRVYPYSDQANSVVDVLRFALERENITQYLGFDVQKVRFADDQYHVTNGEETFACDKLIIACGGLAGTKLGGTMSGYKLLGKLGHKATRLRPALVQIKSSWGGVVALKGVRANCYVRIARDQEIVSESNGELQFTEYGISGPVVFEVSRDVCCGAGEWTAWLDFLPELTVEQIVRLLERKSILPICAEELLTGILHNRLGKVLVKSAGINGNRLVGQLHTEELVTLAKLCKAFQISLTETLGMDSAQVTAGGIFTEQFDSNTMESKLMPGLYACGEVLDVDGDCGGYNLQWAWASGRLAGLSAGKDKA